MGLTQRYTYPLRFKSSAAPFLLLFAFCRCLIISLIILFAKLEASCLLLVCVVVIAYRVRLDAGQLLRQLVKECLDVLARLGRCLKKEKVHALGVLLSFLEADLTAIGQVGLVAGEDEQNVVVAEGLGILNPFVHAGERLARGDVVADDGDGRVLDVGGNQTFESLLASRVPQVQYDDLVLHVHLLRHEVNSNRRLVRIIEAVIDKSMDDTRLTDRLVP